MIATIIGGTGLTGSLLVQRLLADPAVTEVIAISRRALQIAHAKLTEMVVADLADLPAVADRIRGDWYFSCLGTTIKAAGSKRGFERIDHDAIVGFAKLARAHDARSFTLVSAMGANARSMFFYNQVKGRTEDDVKALELRSLIIFKPALLVGPRREFRFAERLAVKTLVPLTRLLPTRARKTLVTEAETLATRMLQEGRAAVAGVHVIQAKEI